MTGLLELEDAQSRLLHLAPVAPVKNLAVANCLNHYLAEPLLAMRTQPAADLSVMDGYAVGDCDGGNYRLIGASAAGRCFQGQLAAGDAVRISTGAVVPAGARSVWPQEICSTKDGIVKLSEEAPFPADSFIRRAGSDFQRNDCLLGAGQWIGPAVVALAIMAGWRTLPVRREPNIAIVQTGDELTAGSRGTGQHHSPACNGQMVAGMLHALPCHVRLLPIAPDRIDALVRTFSQCSDAEVIVTIGGASVGDHDLVRQALTEWGAVHEFWGIAIKPGRPLLVAQRGSQIVLGLPGNPASAFVTAFLFLLPLVRHMLGAANPLPAIAELPLGCNLPPGGTRREFLRAQFEGGLLQLAGSQHSSAIHSLAYATHLIDRPASAPPAPPNSVIRCFPLFQGLA